MSMTDTAFCIDLNEKYTRVCDLRMVQDSVELISLGYEETVPFFYDTESERLIENEARIISDLCTKLKIKKKQVNVVMPDEFTFSQIVEMPQLKEKELLAAIRYQADEFIPMPIDETNLDLEILMENNQTRKLLILIVASPKKTVTQLQKTVELARLVPNSLENELSASARFFSEISKPTTQGSTLLVNFGYTNTSLYLIDGNTKLVSLARTFKIGLNLFIKDMKVNMNWDDKKIIDALRAWGLSPQASYNIEPIIAPLLKGLLQEIEKFIVHSREKYNNPVQKIVTFNFDKSILGLSDKIQAYFSIPTESATLGPKVVQNPVFQSFTSEISSFISVASGNFR
jgi:type IV pilus assembly protein PilM